MSSKSILIISSYTVSKLVRFFLRQCRTRWNEQQPMVNSHVSVADCSSNPYKSSYYYIRQSSQTLLHVPKINPGFGRRAFSSVAPQIWNHTPTAIRVLPSLDSFKRHLKTNYFALPQHSHQVALPCTF